MNSTSKFEVKNILEVKDLNLYFDINIHSTHSLRDRFVSFSKDPLGQKKTVRRYHVIKDFSLNVKEGDRIGIIGANGTGKTTFCRSIAGMYSGHKGEINLNGKVRAIFNTSMGIMPELTGRENTHLLCQLMYPEISDKTRNEMVKEIVEFSDLKEFIDVPYKSYSKGMQSRLTLSIISAKPTDLLILDEVFDGADQFFQKKISKRVMNLIESSGAVLFVSHSTELIKKICNRAILIGHGQIIQDGTPEEITDSYIKLGQNHFSLGE